MQKGSWNPKISRVCVLGEAERVSDVRILSVFIA